MPTFTLRRAVASVAVATCATLAVPAAAANAQTPLSAPVAGTHCTVGQVERATAKVAPKFWSFLQEHPKAKDHFEAALAATPAERMAMRQKWMAKRAEWKKEHPGMVGMWHHKHMHMHINKAEVHQKISEIKAICATS